MRRAARVAFLILLASEILPGDGGALQFRTRAGSFLLTVFSAPMPLRVGSADLSVMVQKASSQDVILDARLLLDLTKPQQREMHEIVVPATRDQAANKLLYAARMTFPSAGQWRLNLSVTANGETAHGSGDLAVMPGQTPLQAYWPYFAVPPLAILFFVMNQWLKGKRRARRC